MVHIVGSPGGAGVTRAGTGFVSTILGSGEFVVDERL